MIHKEVAEKAGLRYTFSKRWLLQLQDIKYETIKKKILSVA